MFALFFSLYMGMLTGNWYNYQLGQIGNAIKPNLNGLGTFLTSIFGDNTYSTLGDVLTSNDAIGNQGYLIIIALVLATITSIGIVVMAVKGVKKAFGIFFMGLR